MVKLLTSIPLFTLEYAVDSMVWKIHSQTVMCVPSAHCSFETVLQPDSFSRQSHKGNHHEQQIRSSNYLKNKKTILFHLILIIIQVSDLNTVNLVFVEMMDFWSAEQMCDTYDSCVLEVFDPHLTE